MVEQEEFDSYLRAAHRSDQRFALLGALLAKETGLGDKLVVVGGSAITIYSYGLYVSGDIDVVGGRAKIAAALDTWGFRHDGRYWVRKDLGLVVEPVSDEYAGLASATTRVSTAVGPVRVAAPEDLIVRRLIYSKGEFGEKSRRAMDEAVLLFKRFEPDLNSIYLSEQVGYEELGEAFSEMVRRAKLTSQPEDTVRRPKRRLRANSSFSKNP